MILLHLLISFNGWRHHIYDGSIPTCDAKHALDLAKHTNFSSKFGNEIADVVCDFELTTETERLHYLLQQVAHIVHSAVDGDCPVPFGTGRRPVAHNGVVHCVNAL